MSDAFSYVKTNLLTTLCGTICPGCGEAKTAYQWTCSPCYRRHNASPEHEALNAGCDEHMRQAADFIRLVRRSRHSPESD